MESTASGVSESTPADAMLNQTGLRYRNALNQVLYVQPRRHSLERQPAPTKSKQSLEGGVADLSTRPAQLSLIMGFND